MWADIHIYIGLRYSLLPPVMVLIFRNIKNCDDHGNMILSSVERRSRDGGLRQGEMERDAMLAHGIAQFMKESSVEKSDLYACYVCDKCGLFAHRVPKKKYYKCSACDNSTRISKIVIPYAFKLFLQELKSMSIVGRIRTSKTISTPKDA